jgi:regulator of CtrA degradation
MQRKAPTADRNMVSFAHHLASSEAFKSLFREGMMLVEEAAAYLDGPGRQESRILPRHDALAYASESMRLTTRLMQMASWLLLQRAVNEGDLTPHQARTDKHRVNLTRHGLATPPDAFARLPDRLQELAMASHRLQGRIIHLDDQLYGQPYGEAAPVVVATPTIHNQLASLQAAFGARNAG